MVIMKSQMKNENYIEFKLKFSCKQYANTKSKSKERRKRLKKKTFY